MSFLPSFLYSSVSIALQHKVFVLAVGENGTAEPARRSAKLQHLPERIAPTAPNTTSN
jgi:hypothetical protein